MNEGKLNVFGDTCVDYVDNKEDAVKNPRFKGSGKQDKYTTNYYTRTTTRTMSPL